jgi:hypothetical protein
MMRLMPVVLLSIFCGCARYEFEVLEPPEFRTHVGRTKQTATDVRREPFDYHMRAYEGRLVMNVYNNDEEPIELLGDHSFVVDPEGESHPLSGAVIAPKAYVKLILPPLRPYYRTEPRFGFGLGIGVSHYDFHRHHHHRHFRGPRFRQSLEPEVWDMGRTYFHVNGPASLFWEWEGESTIRLRLTYRRQNDETFFHEFVIRRVKV